MKAKISIRRVLYFLALIAVFLLMIRFFPIVIQMIEVAALSIRSFWSLILIIALIVWLIWYLRKQNAPPRDL